MRRPGRNWPMGSCQFVAMARGEVQTVCPYVVMPGLVPGIHVLCSAGQDVDVRDKPGHDAAESASLQISIVALSECSWMKSRRGSTTSPISLVKMSSASSTSLTFTCSSERTSVLSVVSQSCSGFISPRPL